METGGKFLRDTCATVGVAIHVSQCLHVLCCAVCHVGNQGWKRREQRNKEEARRKEYKSRGRGGEAETEQSCTLIRWKNRGESEGEEGRTQ